MTFNGAVECERNEDEVRGDILKEAKKFFKPEFINRLDEVILFKSHSMTSLEKICRLSLVPLRENLRKRNINLRVSAAAIRLLAKNAAAENFGCRPLRKMIRDRIETPIAKKILQEGAVKISIGARSNKLYIK